MFKGIKPNGWKISLLDEVTNRGSGHTPNKRVSEYWNGGIAWVSLADSSKLDCRYIEVTDKEISEQGIKNSSAVLHPKNTVILSRDAGVGKSALLAKRMAVSQHFIAWQCEEKGILDPLFLYYWLQLNKKEFERQAVGSTIKTIGLPYFKKLRICYPLLQEQQRIAQTLQLWDNAIEKLEVLIETKQQRKKALMSRLLTGRVRIPGFTAPWQSATLQDIADVSSRRTNTAKSTSAFVAMDDVSNDGFLQSYSLCDKLTLYSGFSAFQDSDTLVAKITPCFENGKGAFVQGLPEGIGLGSTEFHVLRPHSDTYPEFLYYVTRTSEFRALGTASMQGSGGQQRVPADFLKKYVVRVPEFEEQRRIAKILRCSDQELVAHRCMLEKINTQKKALMQQLLTGKKHLQTA